MIPDSTVPKRWLAPELRAYAQLLAPMEVDADSIHILRQGIGRAALPHPSPTECFARGGEDAPDVRLLIVDPAPDTSGKPALLYIHAGGFVLGNPDKNIRQLQEIALEHNCVVVAVNYRLAPETCFPGALEDCYAALRWLHVTAPTLGIDSSRIAIMGVSAGGGHAASLAIAARDRGEFPIAFQLLIYPMLDDRTGVGHGLPEHIGTYVWPAAANRYGWSAMLGVPAGSDAVCPQAVPARVEQLAGLPPTFIGVGSLDLFINEDIEFARRLILTGVPTELVVVPGAPHGFASIAFESDIARRFATSWNQALARAFVR